MTLYSLFDTKSFWPQSPLPQVFYGSVPATPAFVLEATRPLPQPTQRPIIYSVQSGWYAPNKVRPRYSSDDVFVPENSPCGYQTPVYGFALPQTTPSIGDDVFIQAPPAGAAFQDVTAFEGPNSEPSVHWMPSSAEVSPESSRQSYNSNHDVSHSNYSGPFSSPRKELEFNSETMSSLPSSSNSSPRSCHYDESVSYNHGDNVIATSLYPRSWYSDETTNALTSNNTTSHAHANTILEEEEGIEEGENEERKHNVPHGNDFNKPRGRFITSTGSVSTCPRFSQNGVSDELDNCDKILLQARHMDDPGPQGDPARQREDFLLTLDAERQRQRRLVLPRFTPKMSCKFCKNNGESPEVFSKHRLHYNEKTVCPLLRHYVCRLCGSTGDFAHTIRHCPFNSRKDKLAWKATFLV